MDLARDELLARAGLARDEDADVGRRDLLKLAEHLQHRRADADDLAEALVLELGGELLLVGAQGVDSEIAFWRMSDACPAKIESTSSCERSKRPLTRSLPTYIAPVTCP